MSSTNRSKARDNHIADYYVTPIQPIMEFLDHFQLLSHSIPINALILDPCAGGDAENEMSYPFAIRKRFDNEPINIRTIDIREDSKAEFKSDYLNFDVVKNLGKNPDVIITNPPFCLAMPIIEKALNDVKYGGFVVMLLRLNYFGSDTRFPFWQKNLPKYVYVHHKRLSFTKDKKTDSIEYMHCCWQKGVNPSFTQLRVI